MKETRDWGLWQRELCCGVQGTARAPSGHEVCTQHHTKCQEPFPGKHLQRCPAPESQGPCRPRCPVSSDVRATSSVLDSDTPRWGTALFHRAEVLVAGGLDGRRGPSSLCLPGDSRANGDLLGDGLRSYFGKDNSRVEPQAPSCCRLQPSPLGLSEHQQVPALAPLDRDFFCFPFRGASCQETQARISQGLPSRTCLRMRLAFCIWPCPCIAGPLLGLQGDALQGLSSRTFSSTGVKPVQQCVPRGQGSGTVWPRGVKCINNNLVSFY